MAYEGQSAGQNSYLFSQNCAAKTVASTLKATHCLNNLESDSSFSRTVPDCLHETSTNPSFSNSSNFKEKFTPLQNSTRRQVAFDSIAGSEQFLSKPSQFSSSSSFHDQPFTHINKFQVPRYSYGKFPLKDVKTHPYSAKIHSPPYQSFSRKFNGNFKAPTDLVRGPRSNRIHFPSSAEKNEVFPLITRDQFNRSDFLTKYEHAKFFMIKSFSEDDIHKSIKYRVWASTSNGNKKLDAAFRDAMNESSSTHKCPVFLFFSVNASGQFVGLAEMIGPVDYMKSMEFWLMDQWNGFFPLKWHIIKDIPNRYFQNITLENNDNRSVTFSRDTQEIGLPQGLKMLQFFKSYPLARSLLDDFDFYEQKEKSLNDQKRRKQRLAESGENANHDYFPDHLEAEFGKMII